MEKELMQHLWLFLGLSWVRMKEKVEKNKSESFETSQQLAKINQSFWRALKKSFYSILIF